MLISAGSLYDRKANKLRHPHSLAGADVALDSAGFVAMTVHGGVYPWSAGRYLDLVDAMQPAWYASRDYCVEPEIATDVAERTSRIHKTVDEYHSLCTLADARGLPRPVPVLQGWHPDDYLKCASLMAPLPDLVGIGSVCRRSMRGPAGLAAVLDACCTLPCNLHLFGVKGPALNTIRHDLWWHQKVQSTDSHAWDYACRMQGIKTLDGRMAYLQQWYARHCET